MRVQSIWVVTALLFSFSNGQAISTLGRCGPEVGLTCLGSVFGNCCSQYGWCGSTSRYCKSGCQNGFGTCRSTPVASSSIALQSSSTRAASSAASSATLKVSTNARCGKGFAGFTCQGSPYGSCCSQYSYCGSTSTYCGSGCQQGFGSCNAVPLSVLSSALISNSLTSPLASSSSSAPSALSSSSLSSLSSSTGFLSSTISSTVTVASSNTLSALLSSSSLQSVTSTQLASSTPSISSNTISSTLTTLVASTSRSSTSISSTTSSAPISSMVSSSGSLSTLRSISTVTLTSASISPSAISSSCARNLFVNPTFDTGNTDSWSIAGAFPSYMTQTVVTSESTKYWAVTITGPPTLGDPYYSIWQNVNIETEMQLEVSVRVRVTVPNNQPSAVSIFAWYIDEIEGPFDARAAMKSGDGWVQYSRVRTMSAGQHKVALIAFLGGSSAGTQFHHTEFVLKPAACNPSLSTPSARSLSSTIRTSASSTSTASPRGVTPIAVSDTPPILTTHVSSSTRLASSTPVVLSQSSVSTPSPSCLPSANLLSNPGFETGDTSSWTKSASSTFTTKVSTSDGHMSKNYLQLTCPSGGCSQFGIEQSVTVAKDTLVGFSVWVYLHTELSSEGADIGLFVDGQLILPTYTTVIFAEGLTEQDWYEVASPSQFTLTAGTHVVKVTAQLTGGGRQSQLGLDDIQLKTVSTCPV